MIIDKTYAPLRSEFDTVLDRYFGNLRLSPEQRRNFEKMFFAGAAAAYDTVVNRPEQQGTLFDELIDHADELARGGE
jgi:hypothetical protein